jgi:hypothetical protein
MKKADTLGSQDGCGPAHIEMLKRKCRRRVAEDDPMKFAIVKQIDGNEPEDQDDPRAHHGHARR